MHVHGSCVCFARIYGYTWIPQGWGQKFGEKRSDAEPEVWERQEGYKGSFISNRAIQVNLTALLGPLPILLWLPLHKREIIHSIFDTSRYYRWPWMLCEKDLIFRGMLRGTVCPWPRQEVIFTENTASRVQTLSISTCWSLLLETWMLQAGQRDLGWEGWSHQERPGNLQIVHIPKLLCWSIPDFAAIKQRQNTTHFYNLLYTFIH